MTPIVNLVPLIRCAALAYVIASTCSRCIIHMVVPSYAYPDGKGPGHEQSSVFDATSNRPSSLWFVSLHRENVP